MKETRNCKIEKRNEDSRIVEGYAIVFNSESRDLCLLNHNEDRGILARSKYGAGSLKLEVDSTGLKYSFEAPCTNLGDELLEGLKRGDITTSSFAFTIDSDTWTKRENGSYIRTINKFKELFDVSPVYKEAYPDTSVALRKLESFDKEDLTDYYMELRHKLQ